MAEQTEGKLPALLAKGSPSPDTAMMLVNAVYFFAGWGSAFPEESTHPEEFSLLDGGKVSVPMMRNTT